MRLRHWAMGAALTLSACGKKEEGPKTPPPDVATTPAEPAKPDAAEAPKADPADAAEAPKADAAEAPKADAAEAPKADAAEAPATPAGPVTAGPAWFALADGLGVVKLEGGVFTKFALEGTRNFYSLAAGSGHVYASAIGGLFELEGSAAKKLAAEYGDFEHATVAPDGTLWGASFDGVALLKDGTVTKEAKSAIGGGDGMLQDIAVDGKGRVWVATPDALLVKDGGTWTKVKPAGLDDQPFFESLFVASGGRVGAVWMNGIVVQKGDGWEVIRPKADMETIVGGGAGENGDIYIVAYDKLYIVKPDGNQITVSKDGGTFKANKLSAVDGDANGRIWLDTDNGLVILGPDGKLVAQWTPGQVAELAGDIDQLLVEGGGPELPTSFTKAAVGSVKGKFLKAGTGVPDLDIELCPEPKMVFRDTPCEAAAFVRKGKSGADGAWELGDVPAGGYKFAVKSGEKWSLFNGECCSGIKEGQAYDIGSLNLDD